MEDMKLKKYRTYAVAILLLLTLAISGIAFKANAATTAAISYSSSKSTVRAGDSFDINVNIAGVSSLYGASIDFKYDPTLFKINGISKGSIFGTVKSGTPVNSTSSGLISFYCTLQGSSAGLNSTSTKSLFVIHAKALKNGGVNLKTIATNGTLSNTGNNVRIKLADSTKATNPIKYTASNKILNVGGVAPVSIGSVAVDKSSPQLIGAKVKITANASGGANKLYKFSVLQGSTWKVVRDYSSTNYYYWTPAKAGSYKVKAEVKDGTNGKEIAKEFSYTINSGISFSSIKTDKASPQKANTSIKITANASGSANLLYKFMIYDGSSWKTVRDFSSSNYYTWKPTKAAKHTIKVEVKDSATGKVVSKSAYYTVSSTVSSSVKISSLKTDKASPQKANTKIKFTASASGSANLLYKFSVYDGRSWKTVKNYSSTSYTYWTPTKVAKHTIKVEVKNNSTGKVVSKSAYFTVTPNLTISSIKTSLASPQVVKSKIKVTAYASGSSRLLYRFRIYNGSSWKTVRNYSSSSTYYWTPTKAAKHKIKVEAKDSKTGKIVPKEISYTVSSGIKVTAISTSKAAPQKRNTTIKLTAKTSGSANLLYKFSIYDGRYWKVVRNFSSSITYSWKPTKAATYKIWVDVKDVYTGKTAYRQIYYKIS